MRNGLLPPLVMGSGSSGHPLAVGPWPGLSPRVPARTIDPDEMQPVNLGGDHVDPDHQ